jgi:hypothetical protein
MIGNNRKGKYSKGGKFEFFVIPSQLKYIGLNPENIDNIIANGAKNTLEMYQNILIILLY